MKIDRRVLTNFEWLLPLLVVSICAVGVMNLYSAGSNLPFTTGTPSWMKQMYWIGMGLVAMMFCLAVDYRHIVRHGYIIYGISILLLAGVLLYGSITHGSQRWLSLGDFSFQPSELVKLTMVIALIKYIDERNVGTVFSLPALMIPFVIVMLPVVMIIKQPDLGTGVFLLLLFLSIILFAGVEMRAFFTLVAAGVAFLPVMWFAMKEYQRDRLLMFLNPERDPLGAGYHIIQSIIAVGSGGLIGKGYMKGTQSQLKFLPEQQTDFVFSVFAEEWGFLGVIAVLALFFSILLWGFHIARRARDFSGSMLAFGMTMIIFWGVFVNVGMVLGILPVVGIPLPFMSYGGSCMVVLMMAVGLMMNVSMRRFVLQS
ncbi:MAG: rod shape-determining protein RodA [Syntrophales bacterium]|jgi:rod shape determining protein RodA|nr:rod shape-determining protein RodA [Syntrophales bacterium]MCK9528126.1 rod shape-determining protein RodA [Syntrophales bacterium]MDX9921095.1 rod shape-determining protein RodA [Syntrophales bacterium]